MSHRTEDCGPTQARTRLEHAKKFHEVAELAATEGDDVDSARSVAAALAVLAGIAASDAACCARLSMRSRGQSHHQALDLLGDIAPDGGRAARHLKYLLDLKDGAHYGLIHISNKELTSALRHSRALVDYADQRVRG